MAEHRDAGPGYTVVRTRRKTLALQVKADLSVVVRAPMRVSDAAIRAFVADHTGWVEARLARLRDRLARHPEPDEARLVELRQAAQAYIPGRVQHFSARMGLEPTGVKITAARTRFGSCSGKNSLCFSCRLMDYPPEAVDYVVVHELAHIVHKNHGPDFYRLVAEILPDWRQLKALLT